MTQSINKSDQHIQIPTLMHRVISNDSVKDLNCINISIPDRGQTITPDYLDGNLESFINIADLAMIMQGQNNVTKSGKNGLSGKYQKLIKTLKMTKSSQCCAICQNGFEKDELIKKIACKHIFHRECLKPWLKINKKCPNCRFDIEQHFKKEEEQQTAVKKLQ